uniref:F-box domain-containing protein n=1 Tax=Caenorhabditis tropicalis TaxID=1561998 RepID=A0A1I7UI72_9PELO
MSEFIKNHPSAIEVFVYYEREKGKCDLYEKLCNVIGDYEISEEEFKAVFEKVTNMKQREIRQLVVQDQSNLRLCILSDVIYKKSINESAFNIAKMIGTQDIDGQDFEFWFNRFSSGNCNLDQKTFYDLPIEILENIVEHLNFPSQMRLRKVSHGLRKIMDERRPSIDCMYFIVGCPSSRKTLNLSIDDSKGPESDGYWKRSYHGENNIKILFNGIKTLLNNPRLRLRNFEWDISSSSEIDVQFIDIINSSNHKIEIVKLEANFDSDLMVDLVKAIKPGTLEEIAFGEYEYSFGRYDIPGSNDQLDVTINGGGIYFVRKTSD